MSRAQFLVATSTYILGMMTIIWGAISDPVGYTIISLGSLLVMTAWIICLMDTARQKPFNLLWFWFIFFVGAIGIPAYLSTLGRKRKTMHNNG